MSKWDELGLDNLVKEILMAAHFVTNDGEQEYYFLTGYDLALEVNHRDPSILVKLGYDIGGKGTGRQVSLSQYLPKELSRRIKAKYITDIERGYLYPNHIVALHYEDGDIKIESSSAGSDYSHSMYRYKG